MFFFLFISFDLQYSAVIQQQQSKLSPLELNVNTQASIASAQQQQSYASLNGDLFNNMPHLAAKRSYSPFDVSPSFGFNNFIGSSSSQSSASLQSNPNQQYYNGAFSYGQQASADSRLSDHMLGKLGAESASKYPYGGGAVGGSGVVGSGSGVGRYMDDSSLSSPYTKPYEDDTFLSNLHAGQRLNSEVCSCFNHVILNRHSWSVILLKNFIFIPCKLHRWPYTMWPIQSSTIARYWVYAMALK